MRILQLVRERTWQPRSGSSVLSVNQRLLERLEAENALVILKLPSVASDSAAAVMRPDRPVLLVTPGRRVARAQLLDAIQMLRRLDTPCAGVVMSESKINGTHG